MAATPAPASAAAAAAAPAAAAPYDAVVVGGGPSGATAAERLARQGLRVALLDRDGRIKPCGGAIPPRLIRDFDIPDPLLVAKITSARMISPSDRQVDMPIEGGFVGMVDREAFDEWLRARAAEAGAERLTGTYVRIDRDASGAAVVRWRPKSDAVPRDAEGLASAPARLVIGADGARSAVARQEVPRGGEGAYVIAYHEIVRAPRPGAAETGAQTPAHGAYSPTRCDVIYKGAISPDFYGWVFPHGACASVGMGTAVKGVSLREATAALRRGAGLAEAETLREEGAPIPLKPLKRWDNGRDVLLAGDAAGVVAPASGEGIYYAMVGGQLAAEAGAAFLSTGDARALKTARRAFMRAHGRVFWILGMMQRFWYKSDRRRERFVTICKDRDVQRLTWQAYMHKELTRERPATHARIFFKDLAHLFGVVSPEK